MNDHRLEYAFQAIAAIAAGASVESVESELLDCKEDPTRRGPRGELLDGLREDDGVAMSLAPEAACLGNAEGGILVIGVDDKASGMSAFRGTSLDRAWLAHRIYELTDPPIPVEAVEHEAGGQRLLLLRIPRNAGSEPHAAKVSKGGGRRVPRRIGRSCHDMTKVAELVAWAAERAGYDWSDAPAGVGLEAVRPAALDRVRELLRATGETERMSIAEMDAETLMRRLQLLRGDGGLNRAGQLLLCGTDAARLLYLAREAPGMPSTQRIELTGRSLVEEIEQVELAIQSRNRSFVLDQQGLVQRTMPALPPRAYREALINAVMHRDWDMAEPIVVDHIGDHLIIYSPGTLLDGLTPKSLLMAQSRTRNRRLGSALRSLRLAEQEGTGIDKMYVDMVRLGHEPPRIEQRDGGIRVALVGGAPTRAVFDAIAKLPAVLQQDARFAMIFHMLRRAPSVTAHDVAEALQIGVEEGASFLQRCVGDGALRRTAKARPDGTPAWRLADDLRDSLGPVLPYFARPAGESLDHIVLLASQQGSVSNQDVQDLLGVKSGRATSLLKMGTDSGRLALAPGAQARGRSARYVAV